MIVWYLDIQLPMQPVPITTKVVTSNPVHGEVYSIQHYVIMFVSDLWQVSGFSDDHDHDGPYMIRKDTWENTISNKISIHVVTEDDLLPNEDYTYVWFVIFILMWN
jgi:hypothetical protein